MEFPNGWNLDRFEEYSTGVIEVFESTSWTMRFIQDSEELEDQIVEEHVQLIMDKGLKLLELTNELVPFLVVNSNSGPNAIFRYGSFSTETAHQLAIWLSVGSIFQIRQFPSPKLYFPSDTGSIHDSSSTIASMVKRERYLAIAGTDTNGHWKKNEEKKPQHSWDEVAMNAALKFVEERKKDNSLTLKDFCNKYAIDNECCAATTLLKKLTSHRKLWDPRGECK